MVDRPPPSRLTVVERDGRLLVVDRITGETPPTAAERMAEHDRRMGVEAVRPELPESVALETLVPAPPPRTVAVPKAARPAARSVAQGRPSSRGPWGKAERKVDVPASFAAATAKASGASHAQARPAAGMAGVGQPITTSPTWDARGPRTVHLGAHGRATLESLALVLLVGLALFITFAVIAAPFLLIGAAFVFFRGGREAIAKLGAMVLDKAIAADRK